MPCEDEGRVEGDASTWQGIPNIARKASEAQRVCIELILLTALKRNQPQCHLDFGLVASRTVRQSSSCCLSHSVCCT